MSLYTVEVRWRRGNDQFTDNRYSRVHVWRFDGGMEITASASPDVVPIPLSSAAAVDPEEAFVASLSSCHMLWFLSLAAQRGYCVDEYADEPVGEMGVNAAGKIAMLRVTLRPKVRFSGVTRPDQVEFVRLHEAAHEQCFIANSVKTKVICEPTVEA